MYNSIAVKVCSISKDEKARAQSRALWSSTLNPSAAFLLEVSLSRATTRDLMHMMNYGQKPAAADVVLSLLSFYKPFLKNLSHVDHVGLHARREDRPVENRYNTGRRFCG